MWGRPLRQKRDLDPVTGPPEGPQSWHMLCAGGKQPQPWKVGKLRPERQRDLALHAG